MTELEKAQNVGLQLLSPGSGGGRGTGIEPSPRRPTWKKVAQRMAPVTAAQSRSRLEAEAQNGRQPALPWAQTPPLLAITSIQKNTMRRTSDPHCSQSPRISAF